MAIHWLIDIAIIWGALLGLFCIWAYFMYRNAAPNPREQYLEDLEQMEFLSRKRAA